MEGSWVLGLPSISQMLELNNSKVRSFCLEGGYWERWSGFCTAKEIISKIKRQPTEYEKIVTNPLSDKELISKINKELVQPHSKNKIK